MKKFLAGLVILFVLMVSMPVGADAQNRFNRNRRSSVSRDSRYYNNRNYRNRNYRNNNYSRGSFYQRHRNLINIGAGTGAGALIGGILGGRAAHLSARASAREARLFTPIKSDRKEIAADNFLIWNKIKSRDENSSRLFVS